MLKPLLVEVGTPETIHLEKANPHKVEVGTEQVVLVLGEILLVLLVKTLHLRILPVRCFFHEPSLSWVFAQKFSGTLSVRAL